MGWVVIAVQWLHVLGGIFWFGGVLFTSVVLAPAVMSLAPQTARTVFEAIGRRVWVGETVGGVTILLGIVRGTLLGPVKSLDFLLGTAYGITWGIALLLGLGILALGHFVITPSTDRMLAAIESSDKAEMRRQVAPVLLVMGGFLGIFTCMILMRFGL